MLSFLFVALIALVQCSEDPDVVVLTTANFDDFLASNEFVLAEFYAPWCGHCKKLTPEYGAAATTLKESGSLVKLAKIDATVESSLGERFGVRGYPTIKFFRSGSPVEYDGGRTAGDIVNWVTKKSGPPSKHLTTADEVSAYLGGSGTRAIAFAPANADIWATVGKSEKTQAFALAHVTDASLLDGRKEGTVELHKDGESPLAFDGEFDAESLITWLAAEGFPLVDELSQDSWTRAQTSQTDLLAVFFGDDAEVAKAAALEVAKAHKGKLVVTSSSQVGIATRWGSSGNVSPTTIYVSNKVAGQPSFVIWNEEKEGELNGETLKAFVAGSQDGSYETYVKSEPIPADNNGPVKVVVGKSFDDIVRAEKDVLIEFYAPWCGHCKKLEPIYDELGTHFAGDDNIVIAKMDATANGTPKDVNIQGFPTILFFDANNKVTSYDGERELEAFKTWLNANRVSKAGAEKEDL